MKNPPPLFGSISHFCFTNTQNRLYFYLYLVFEPSFTTFSKSNRERGEKSATDFFDIHHEL